MKENIKNILIFVLGITISITGSVVANTLINSKEVVYDNTTSGLKSTTVQGAVDELYSAATDYSTLNNKIKNMETTIIDKIYPKGSIYMSTEDDTVEKMHNLYGGTWEKYGEGRTLVSAGTITDDTGNVQTYIAGDTGGSSDITLTTANLPSHSHTYTPSGTNSYSTSKISTEKQSANHTHNIPKLSGSTSSTSKTLTGNMLMHGGDVATNVHAVSGILGYDRSSSQYLGFNSSFVTSGAPSIGNITIDATHSHNISTTASATEKQSADHTHSITATNLKTAIGTITFTGTEASTSNTGSGTSINVQNPYTVIYMYKRVN